MMEYEPNSEYDWTEEEEIDWVWLNLQDWEAEAGKEKKEQEYYLEYQKLTLPVRDY
jgi:hypothetical protein